MPRDWEKRGWPNNLHPDVVEGGPYVPEDDEDDEDEEEENPEE